MAILCLAAKNSLRGTDTSFAFILFSPPYPLQQSWGTSWEPRSRLLRKKWPGGGSPWSGNIVPACFMLPQHIHATKKILNWHFQNKSYLSRKDCNEVFSVGHNGELFFNQRHVILIPLYFLFLTGSFRSVWQFMCFEQILWTEFYVKLSIMSLVYALWDIKKILQNG